jgi:hypothetical protein
VQKAVFKDAAIICMFGIVVMVSIIGAMATCGTIMVIMMVKHEGMRQNKHIGEQ